MVAAAAAMIAGARPSLAVAKTMDRFVAWLAAHPEVQMVAVSSDVGVLPPFATRFGAGPKSKIPPSARVRIVDARGSLICLTRPPAHVCVRGPAAPHVWTDEKASRDNVRRREDVLVLGPLAEGRAAVYSLRVPEGIACGGEPLRMNPKWIDEPHLGPWWAFEYETPYSGDPRVALRKAAPLAPANDAPDWLDDAVGFSSTVDEVHPGLPPTYPGLPPQLPAIYAAQAGFQGDVITVAIERSWIRSKNAHTPSLEWTGTFVEIVELRPGAAAFSRRATPLELTSGRLTHMADSRSGFPAVASLSPSAKAWCIDVVAAGIIPPRMRTTPLGRYCVGADGRLGQAPGAP